MNAWRHTYCRNNIGDAAILCIWAEFCINDMIHGLIANIECYYLLCFVEEVIQVIYLCLAIIDFVNNCIWSLAYIYIYLKDSLKCLWSTNPLQAHILVVFVLSRKQVHHQWIVLFDYLLLGQQSVKGNFFDLVYYPLAFHQSRLP
jgi:hypothetical protein